MILVDTKEQEVADYLQLLKADYKVAPLDCDFIVGDFFLERKTWNDFQQSIKDGRIHKSLNKFKSKLIFLVEYGNREDRMSDKSILAMIARIIASGNSILFLRDARETAKFLKYLDEKLNSPCELIYLPQVDKRNWGDLKIALLSCLPGVGVKKAFKIIEHFGSLRNFLNSPKVEKEKVLGKKTVEKIENFLSC